MQNADYTKPKQRKSHNFTGGKESPYLRRSNRHSKNISHFNFCVGQELEKHYLGEEPECKVNKINSIPYMINLTILLMESIFKKIFSFAPYKGLFIKSCKEFFSSDISENNFNVHREFAMLSCVMTILRL